MQAPQSMRSSQMVSCCTWATSASNVQRLARVERRKQPKLSEAGVLLFCKALFQPTFIGQPETEVGIAGSSTFCWGDDWWTTYICSMGEVPSILPYPLNMMKGYEGINRKRENSINDCGDDCRHCECSDGLIHCTILFWIGCLLWSCRKAACVLWRFSVHCLLSTDIVLAWKV